jgi:hypothetical protein
MVTVIELRKNPGSAVAEHTVAAVALAPGASRIEHGLLNKILALAKLPPSTIIAPNCTSFFI